MDLLESLNVGQQQAVEHIDGPLLVVAGAGTGKTRVITHRIAYLIQRKKAKPQEIIALTFTDKAAAEMADRLYELIGWDSFSVPILTFNSFGSEIMTRYSHTIGRSIKGGLINDTQKMLLIRKRIKDVDLKFFPTKTDSIDFLEKIIEFIGKMQNAGITSHEYTKYVDGLVLEKILQADLIEQQDLALLYKLYDDIKIETGTYDYYDQLDIPLSVMNANPSIAEAVGSLYKYILVDEYQDTSPIQDKLLRHIVKKNGNIFAVGDDDQAIYGFRGADVDNILNFTKHFESSNAIALTQNYRSGQKILDAAYKLIKNNDPDRLEYKLKIDKKLVSNVGQAVVEYNPYGTLEDEQSSVIANIKKHIAKKVDLSEIVILARSNSVLRDYARLLEQNGIPYAISTTINIFEQKELISLWYLLQWIGFRADDEALVHIILGPYIKGNIDLVVKITEISKSDSSSMESALRSLADQSDEAAKEVVNQLDLWREWSLELGVSQLVYKIIFDSGISEEWILKGESDIRVVRIFEDLHRLLNHMQDYETTEEDTTLAGYLAVFPKPPEIEISGTEGDMDGIQLLTVHASKGLEFDTVFVVNLTSLGWGRSKRSSGYEIPQELLGEANQSNLNELRRLLYVAITRAKKELYLSSTIFNSAGRRQPPSPLISEIFSDVENKFEKLKDEKSAHYTLKKIHRMFPLQEAMPERLPFERADGWIHLGVRDMDLYSRSPHDFYLQKVLKIVSPLGPELSFGTAIHGAIQLLYEAKIREQSVSLVELKARIDELWSDKGFISQKMADAARNRAYDIITRFMQDDIDVNRIVVASELPIRLEIPEAKLRLNGRIDALIKTSDGIEVRDFKTGNIKDEESLINKAKIDIQLRTYALAVEQMTGVAPFYLTLDYVATGVVGRAEIGKNILKNHRDKLIDIASKIRAKEFGVGKSSGYNHEAANKYYGIDEVGSYE